MSLKYRSVKSLNMYIRAQLYLPSGQLKGDLLALHKLELTCPWQVDRGFVMPWVVP